MTYPTNPISSPEHSAWCVPGAHIDDEPDEQAVHRSESFELRLIEPPNRDDTVITVAVGRWVRGDGVDESDQRRRSP